MNTLLDPFFSIILPTRDRPDLVRNMLVALQKQEYDNFEIIISDNYVNKSCSGVVKDFLWDDRIVYKSPGRDLNMCDHWNFAIEGCRGDYFTVVNEKLVFRPDALTLLAREIRKNNPDTISWHYDIFRTRNMRDGLYYGHYHPLIKPGKPVSYDSLDELNRRLSFDFPEFSRYKRTEGNHARIYTTFLKKNLYESITSKVGNAFPPIAPDFTSLFYILKFSKKNIDIGQPLMLLNHIDAESNGAACGNSIKSAERFINTFGLDYNKYIERLPVENVFSINNLIASDYALARGRLGESGDVSPIDVVAVAFWSKFELDNFHDLPDLGRKKSLEIIDEIISSDKIRVQELEFNARIKDHGSEMEIYHSGLRKTENFDVNISPEKLADFHWCLRKAPPRKSVLGEEIDFLSAFDYFSRYHRHANTLLGI